MVLFEPGSTTLAAGAAKRLDEIAGQSRSQRLELKAYAGTDKQSASQTRTLIANFLTKMGETWDELPRHFVTSAENKLGREEVLDFITGVNAEWAAEAA